MDEIWNQIAQYATQNMVTLVCTAILLGWIGFVVTLERLFPYTPGFKFFRPGFWTDFLWYTVVQSFLLGILINSFIIAPIKASVGFSHIPLINDWPIWGQVLLFLFTHDLYIYWFHRWQHNNKVLWRLHEAHHSCKEVDWLAGARSHFLEILINQTIETLPIFLFLSPENAAIVIPIKGLISATWGIWIHANVDVRTGPLQYVINGPEMHQWHHAEHTDVYFANYGTKFAFWDWMFGTAYLPKDGRKPHEFGLPYDFPDNMISPVNYLKQTLFAFRPFANDKSTHDSAKHPAAATASPPAKPAVPA